MESVDTGRRDAIHRLLRVAIDRGVIGDYLMSSPEGTDDDLRLEAWGPFGTKYYVSIDRIEAFCEGIAWGLQTRSEI